MNATAPDQKIGPLRRWLRFRGVHREFGLKFWAYYLTGSVGMLSDAVEAGVNIAAALVALGVLTYAEAKPDREHNFGHEKVQYFSSGIEGALIFVAAAAIVWSAVPRFAHPQAIEQVGAGLALSVVAGLANAA